jgi:hypothetical protein
MCTNCHENFVSIAKETLAKDEAQGVDQRVNNIVLLPSMVQGVNASIMSALGAARLDVEDHAVIAEHLMNLILHFMDATVSVVPQDEVDFLTTILGGFGQL